MLSTKLSHPLSDAELDEMGHFLARVQNGAIPNIETLDGFLTALVICPELVKPSEYMPIIISGETEAGDLVFETLAEAERFQSLLARHWNDVNRTLRSGEFYMPVLAEDDTGKFKGNDWATGFLAGTRMRHSVWTPIVDDEERGGVFVALFALAYEHAEDPSLRPFSEPISPERREDLLAMMIAGVKRLFDEFAEERKSATVRRPGPLSFGPKIGRNDPCPCGSGKKYKKCCGQVTFH